MTLARSVSKQHPPALCLVSRSKFPECAFHQCDQHTKDSRLKNCLHFIYIFSFCHSLKQHMNLSVFSILPLIYYKTYPNFLSGMIRKRNWPYRFSWTLSWPTFVIESCFRNIIYHNPSSNTFSHDTDEVRIDSKCS